MLIVVPLASVGNEVTYLDSLEGRGETTTPMKRRFDVVYWPLHVGIVLSWALVLAFKAPDTPDVKATLWKMVGVYSVLVVFSYFMHVAGKNYVIQHTDEIQMDKNLQMTAILATFTIVIYIAGGVAAVVTLTTGRLDPDEPAPLSQLASKWMHRNVGIERWPSKIDRISSLYESLLEKNIKKITTNERVGRRNNLVKALKEVYTFNDAYRILQTEMNDPQVSELSIPQRQTFLVKAADIIAESEGPSSPSMFNRIINAVKPAGEDTNTPTKDGSDASKGGQTKPTDDVNGMSPTGPPAQAPAGPAQGSGTGVHLIPVIARGGKSKKVPAPKSAPAPAAAAT